MDSKKIIEQLIKIADKQQKIINKLAQVAEPPAAHLAPASVNKDAAGTLLDALKGIGGAGVSLLKTNGDKMIVTFAPGKKTQANYDAVKAKLEELTNSNQIQMVYQLQVA